MEDPHIKALYYVGIYGLSPRITGDLSPEIAKPVLEAFWRNSALSLAERAENSGSSTNSEKNTVDANV